MDADLPEIDGCAAGAHLGEGGGRPGRARPGRGEGVPGGHGARGERPRAPGARGVQAARGCRATSRAARRETRAWTIPIGAKAPQAAGVIHTDFERGFIKAETASYDRLRGAGRRDRAAATAGKLRQEGKEYVVQDGDVDALQVQRVGRCGPKAVPPYTSPGGPKAAGPPARAPRSSQGHSCEPFALVFGSRLVPAGPGKGGLAWPQ